MNRNKLKFLVIGLGSMGKRRVRNLLKNGVAKENIFGFNITNPNRYEAEKKYGIKTYSTFKEALVRTRPDVFIISTPPDKHWPYFLFAARHKKHFFVEHPTTERGYKELDKLMDGTFVAAPSCTLRFNQGIKTLKKIIDTEEIGRALSFQYHLGQYLPDWHPWEDYRKVYFSKKSTGACREMFAFELGWLSYVLGLQALEVVGFNEKLSSLDMTADDIYSAVIKFKNNIIGNLVIDLLSIKPFRTLRVIGSEGVLEWSWLDHKIKLFKPRAKTPRIINLEKGHREKHYIAAEEMYNDEIKSFLEAIEGGATYPFTFRENHHFLRTLFAMEKSAKSKKVIRINNA